MTKTERKYWESGIHKRGKAFWTFAAAVGPFGVILAVAGLCRWIDLSVYKLEN